MWSRPPRRWGCRAAPFTAASRSSASERPARPAVPEAGPPFHSQDETDRGGTGSRPAAPGTGVAVLPGMDVARPHARRRRIKRIVTVATLVAGLLGGATIAFSKIGKFAPKVGRAALWVDRVQ